MSHEISARRSRWSYSIAGVLSNQAALQAIRRYRAQSMTEPENLQIAGEDFAIAYQALLSQRR
ncbi:hypothetical protein [Leptolyngbya sp. NIES-2104]|uniref:hypothetical protein n=1 Tax=Leptolyngbya sp. NIES-2104 TaxID=1552121 RepID=UPI0006EC4963|nr:hypothetical protein [Leptolyngbya sp. NIES-2104]GAP98667.1 cell division protein FtsH [Leptolyngbya sp. NIES-2104]